MAPDPGPSGWQTAIKVDMPVELKDQIKQAARRADLSMAQWIRACVRDRLALDRAAGQ